MRSRSENEPLLYILYMTTYVQVEHSAESETSSNLCINLCPKFKNQSKRKKQLVPKSGTCISTLFKRLQEFDLLHKPFIVLKSYILLHVNQ